MPSLPRSRCNSLGCKTPSVPHSRFCEQHAPVGKRKDSAHDAMYKGAAWASLRTSQISRQPLCQACLLEGRVASAAHVDHVFPWRTIGPQAFRVNLLQSLCGPCHSRKTGLEQKGTFRHYRTDGVHDYAIGDWNAVANQ